MVKKHTDPPKVVRIAAHCSPIFDNKCINYRQKNAGNSWGTPFELKKNNQTQYKIKAISRPNTVQTGNFLDKQT
jgi:hypothetical protein